MSYEEVVKAYGHPNLGTKNQSDKSFHLFYELAPEKKPVGPARNMYPSGFNVFLRDGKVENWSHNTSNAPRAEKVVGAEKPTLIATLPKMDHASGKFDPVAFVEGITVPNPMQDLNHRDLSDLLSVVAMLATNSTEPAADRNATLSANCDFIKTLANNFPEIAALRENATDGKIPIKALADATHPYTFDGKPFPTKTKKVKPDGTNQPPTVPK